VPLCPDGCSALDCRNSYSTQRHACTRCSPCRRPLLLLLLLLLLLPLSQVLTGLVGDEDTSEDVLELLLSHLVPPHSTDNPLACQ
jgi:hypothetical protein